MPEEEEEEHIFTISLSKCKNLPRTKRARIAIKTIKTYIGSHMKVPINDVWVDASVNNCIWARGIKKPPSKIRVKAIKFEDGLVEVSTLEE
ncbi:MAG: 50S ribosomal protein L31e [Thermoplasmata archaeon]|nr:MAG: 50S ribosomal protein L31e [Thermoplasmata archaeon]